MKKLLCIFLCALLAVPLFTFVANAEDEGVTLTVIYNSNDVDFEGLEISIWRVADIKADGSYALCDKFSNYPIDINVVNTQEEWRTIATTLYGYIVADKLAVTAKEETNNNGEAVFANLGKGLYLISGVQTENNGTVYVFETFFITLPQVDESGVSQYNVTAIPKYNSYVPEPNDIQYKVLKQWNDGGSDKRPASIDVEIYKDGQLQSEQILSSENDWSYVWTAEDDGSKWTVVERNVFEGYTVSVTERDTVFILTNTLRNVTPPPQTGDVFVLWPYLSALFAFGAILVLIPTLFKKVKDE